MHEGGYHPTSRGYDVNAEIEFYDGQFNTACYLNHGARDAAELRQAFGCVHGMLVRSGVRPGARVALLVRNSPQYVASYFGIIAAGCVAVP